MKKLILLIDDDQSLLTVTKYNLKSAGFSVITEASGTKGIETFKKQMPGLVITDVKLGDISGIDVVTEIKQIAPETQVIVFTAFGSIQMAVEAMKRGAFNFIPKPFDRSTLITSCEKALEFNSLKSKNKSLEEDVERFTGADGIKSASKAMSELLDTALRIADSNGSVLITGESGTGKEVLARLIHRNSKRKDNPMICVNCAAIPGELIESELFGHVKGAFTGAISDRKGKFQAAEGGTLFLDEIGEMKTEMQVKLLRAIQEMTVEPVGSDKSIKTDFRLITATNRDLTELIRNNLFREDLYYRINVLPLHIPPLRERNEDIILLANHFLKQFNAPSQMSFSKEAENTLKAYQWPGNIRELQNTIERTVIMSRNKIIEATDLNLKKKETSFELSEFPDDGISLEQMEKSLIQTALKKSKGNKSEAARLLKIPRHVLLYRLEKFDI